MDATVMLWAQIMMQMVHWYQELIEFIFEQLHKGNDIKRKIANPPQQEIDTVGYIVNYYWTVLCHIV